LLGPRPGAPRKGGAAAVAGALLLVLGCGERPDAAVQTVDDPDRCGGTAVVAGYVDIRTMNPFAGATDLNKALQRFALYAPLVMLDSTLAPVPWLAEAWDTVAVGVDSLALTFRMRRDVAWQDGRPTTARDVELTFRHAMDPRSAYVDAASLALFRPEPEVLDSFAVRFVFRRHPDFLEPFFLLPPLPAHVIGDTPPDALARHPLGTAPVGNGPFRFTRRSAQEWVLDANPAFPAALGGPACLARLVYRTTPEQASLITEILTGRIDMAVSIRPPQVRQLETARDVRVITFPVPNWIFLALNTRLHLFRDRDVRRALAMAVDRQALVDGIMGGLNVTGRASVTPVHWAFDPGRQVRFDPDSARLLLERAGWIDRDGDGVREDAAGRPFRFRLKVWQGAGSYRDLAEVVQAQFVAVGIAAQPEVVEFNTFVAQIQGSGTGGGRGRDFDAAIGNWTDNLLRKDDSELFHSRRAESPRQWTGFNSPRLDVLLDSLTVTAERDVARRLWSEYQQALTDESPLLVLFYARGINAVRTRLHGPADGDPRGPLATVATWWVER
jgi:peptide/nickel transport system substrate-binding protein